MNMKRLLTLVAFFATLQASAQQVNPVPDYVFRNQMSVGRNAVTDTAAYFSIGPRYGATKGFMPPIVGDTATFSSGKRNGLLIFSVQKNKFLYWDSVGVKWAEMAGTGGSAITGSGVVGYMPEFTTTTNLDTTTLYHSAGRFAIGSTTTSNGIFNVYGGQSYFDTSLKIGSSLFFADEANSRIGIRTDTPKVLFEIVSHLGEGMPATVDGERARIISNDVNTRSAYISLISGTIGNSGFLFGDVNSANIGRFYYDNNFNSLYAYTNNSLAFISNSAQEFLINTTTDNGDYKLQVNGNIYTSGTSILSASSGNVGIGITSPTGYHDKILHLHGSTSNEIHLTTGGSGTANSDGFVFSLRDSDGLAQLVLRENAAFLLGTNDTERIRMHANGGLKISGQSSPPTAEAGTIYYDTDDNKLKVYNGTTWVDLH